MEATHENSEPDVQYQMGHQVPVIGVTDTVLKAPASFSLQIPFILLGTRAVPDQIYNHAERRTKPLLAIQWFLKQKQMCPNIHCGVWIPSRTPDEDAEERMWEDMKQNGWIVRHGKRKNDARGWIGKWTPGDGELTDREKRRVRSDTWIVPFVLQRFDISIDRKDIMLNELSRILQCLGRGFNSEGDQDTNMRIVCNERCQLKLSFQIGDGGSVTWGQDMVAKALLALAAFEHELTLISGMSSLLSYMPLSRFLTHFGIRQLRKEKAALWKVIDDNRNIDVNDGEEKKEKENWARELQRIEIKDAIDKPELWQMVNDLVGGFGREESLNKLIGEMKNIERRGRRISVGFLLAQDEAIAGEEKEGRSRGSNGYDDLREGVEDEDHTSLILSQSVRSPPSTPEPPEPETFYGVKAIVFQSHESSLDVAGDLAAYIDLVAQLMIYIFSNSYQSLRLRVENFRTSTLDLDLTPHESLIGLLGIVGATKNTKSHYLAFLAQNRMTKTEKGPNNVGYANKDDADDAWLTRTPFDDLLKYVDKRRRQHLEYVPTFTKRYDNAGGFYVVPKRKLYALMVAEETRRKKKKGEFEVSS